MENILVELKIIKNDIYIIKKILENNKPPNNICNISYIKNEPLEILQNYYTYLEKDDMHSDLNLIKKIFCLDKQCIQVVNKKIEYYDNNQWNEINEEFKKQLFNTIAMIYMKINSYNNNDNQYIKNQNKISKLDESKYQNKIITLLKNNA